MPTINFFWDDVGDNVVAELDANNQITTTYACHPEKHGEVFYDKQGNRFSYYHYDGNGSTRKLTGANQAVTKTYIFTGFGELIASPGLGSTPFAYKGAAGYYTNPVTNDIYVRARTYEPTTGRWLSKDPLGFVDGPNLYGAYFVPNLGDHTGLTVADCENCNCNTQIVGEWIKTGEFGCVWEQGTGGIPGTRIRFPTGKVVCRIPMTQDSVKTGQIYRGQLCECVWSMVCFTCTTSCIKVGTGSRQTLEGSSECVNVAPERTRGRVRQNPPNTLPPFLCDGCPIPPLKRKPPDLADCEVSNWEVMPCPPWYF